MWSLCLNNQEEKSEIVFLKLQSENIWSEEFRQTEGPLPMASPALASWGNYLLLV